MSWMITKGTVEDNNDPAKAGRVQASMPEMDDSTYPEWINPIFPGDEIWPPNKGQTILILRPDDDDIIEFAEEIYYFGRMRTQDEPVGSDHQTNYPHRRGFETKAGHALIVDDKTGEFILHNSAKTGTVTLKNDGTIEITGSAKVHLNSPLADLSDLVTDFILKGTTVHSAFTTLFEFWRAALLSPSPVPTDPNWAAYKGLMVPVVTAIQSTLNAWLSTKVKTG